MEAELLNWLRLNQSNLRASDYTALTKALGHSGRGDDEAGGTIDVKLVFFHYLFMAAIVS